MTDRDKMILAMLNRFRVLSRDQIGSLICPEVARPHVTVNRIVKRLQRDGWILQVPRPKDQQYLYMPNPARINMQSSKIPHFLALVDLYIMLKQPEVFEVEPPVSESYRPDAYTRIRDTPIVIEYQRSLVSTKKIQKKVDEFAESFYLKKHDSRVLWLYSGVRYHVKVPDGFTVVHKKPL